MDDLPKCALLSSLETGSVTPLESDERGFGIAREMDSALDEKVLNLIGGIICSKEGALMSV